MIAIRGLASPLRKYFLQLPRKSDLRKWLVNTSRKIHSKLSEKELKVMKKSYHFNGRSSMSSKESLEFLSEFIMESVVALFAVVGIYVYLQSLFRVKNHPLEQRIINCEKEVEQLKKHYNI